MPSLPGAAGPGGAASSSMPGSLEEAKERYESTKNTLRAGLAKKRQIDRTLTDLESQIYLFEGSYLSSTASSGGNIIKGFDGYLKLAHGGRGGTGGAAASGGISGSMLGLAPSEIPIEDRLFSTSSATYTRSLELKANEGRKAATSATARDTSAADESAPAASGKKASAAHKAASPTPSNTHDEASQTTSSKKKRKDAPSASAGAAGAGETTKKKKRKEED